MINDSRYNLKSYIELMKREIGSKSYIVVKHVLAGKVEPVIFINNQPNFIIIDTTGDSIGP